MEYLLRVCCFVVLTFEMLLRSGLPYNKGLSLHVVDPINNIFGSTGSEFEEGRHPPVVGPRSILWWLYGVKSEASKPSFFTLVCDVFADLKVRVVQVGKHEDISIAALVVCNLSSAFISDCIVQAVVVLAISRNIPLETWEQIMVLRCRYCHASSDDVLQGCGGVVFEKTGI